MLVMYSVASTRASSTLRLRSSSSVASTTSTEYMVVSGKVSVTVKSQRTSL